MESYGVGINRSGIYSDKFVGYCIPKSFVRAGPFGLKASSKGRDWITTKNGLEKWFRALGRVGPTGSGGSTHLGLTQLENAPFTCGSHLRISKMVF